MTRRNRPGPLQTITLGQTALVLAMVGIIQESTSINGLLSQIVGRDVWISILLALPVALLGVRILGALAARHPSAGLAEILRSRIGLLAYGVGLAYAALFLFDAALSAQEFAEQLQLLMTATPAWALSSGLLMLSIWSAWLGPEPVARVNSLVLLFFDIPFGVLRLFLFLGQQRLVYLEPILAHGWEPVLIGAQLLVGMFAQFALMLAILPGVRGGARAAEQAGFWAVALVSTTALGHNVGPFLIFGGAARDFNWPLFAQVRSVTAGRFAALLDVLVIELWTHGFWLAATVFLRAAAGMTATTLQVGRERQLIVPLGLAVVGIALLLARLPTTQPIRRFLDADLWLGFGFGLPLLLLAMTAAFRVVRRAPPAHR